MTDMENVIAGLTMLADRKNDDTCEGLKCCKIAEDAIALLKEQEEEIENLKQTAQSMMEGICLLKEQEPHVLSREEMIEAGKNHDAVYVEEGDGRCFWGLAVEGIDPPEDKPYNYPGGVQFNVVDTDDDMWDGDFYLMCDVYPEKRPHPMGWRAWSAKPTPEQMKAVKWE